MGAEIEIKEDHTIDVLNALPEAIDRALEAIGIQATSHAKQNLDKDPMRIDTGLLINSITWARSGEKAAISKYKGASVHGDTAKNKEKGIAGKPAPPPHKGSYSGQAPADAANQKAVYIGTNVEYAIYVHDGTQKMAPNRFLKTAVTEYKDQYKQIAENELKKG